MLGRVRAGRAWLAAGGLPCVAGVLLLAGGVVLPWLGVPLESERRSFSLPVVVPGIARVGGFNYGVIEALCLVAAVVLMVRRGDHSRAALAATGVVAFATGGCFFASTSLADLLLLQHIVNQTSEYHAITAEFGYTIPRTVPSAVVFMPLSGPWRTLANQLRPGWFSALGGGGVLLLWGGRDLLSVLRASRVRVRAALIVAAVVVTLALFGRAIAANLVANEAIASAQAGNYHVALQQFEFMDSLDPDMHARTGVENAWGAALLVVGRRDAPLALLADARAQAASGNTLQQATDLTEAVALAPGDATVTYAYITGLRHSAINTGDPALLADLTSSPYGNLPAEHYTLGRMYYSEGAYAAAETNFTSVLDETDESNVRSSAYTYRALCELRLGDRAAWRTDLLRAVAVDTEYNNSLARSLATGLYQAVPA